MPQQHEQATTCTPPVDHPLLGMQIGPHSLFDEGVENCLDGLRQTADINAIFVYSHTYYGGGRAAWNPRKGNRPLTRVWVRTNQKRYHKALLRHPSPSAHEEYAGRDVLAETIPAAREREMRVFVRLFDPCWGDGALRSVANWEEALSVDAFGSRYTMPCHNNPHYRQWWQSTVEDLFVTYELDGFKYGSERGGPLRHLLFGGMPPGCFCEHCLRRARQEGIDAARAREGFIVLYSFVKQQSHSVSRPRDGILLTVVRILLRYPEILLWESLMNRARDELSRMLCATIKEARPQTSFGLHIHQGPTCCDLLDRAQIDYTELAGYADWIKPCVYPDSAGPRINQWYVQPASKGILGELSAEQALQLLYALVGFDPRMEPHAHELTSRGLTPGYVSREVRRCVEAVNGRVPVYAGVGFDLPDSAADASAPFPSNPQTTFEAVTAALEAGASGLILSREYDEMQRSNIKAAGDATRDYRPRRRSRVHAPGNESCHVGQT